jgi:hypothetical protein
MSSTTMTKSVAHAAIPPALVGSLPGVRPFLPLPACVAPPQRGSECGAASRQLAAPGWGWCGHALQPRHLPLASRSSAARPRELCLPPVPQPYNAAAECSQGLRWVGPSVRRGQRAGVVIEVQGQTWRRGGGTHGHCLATPAVHDCRERHLHIVVHLALHLGCELG